MLVKKNISHGTRYFLLVEFFMMICVKALQSLKKLEDSNVQCTTQPKHLHEMYRLTNLNYLHKDINLNTITIS